MSLIDEALKRAEGAPGRSTGPDRQRPWSHAPLPDAGRAARRLALRTAALAAALALAGAVALILSRSAPDAGAKPPSQLPARPSPVAPTPVVLAEVSVPPPARGVEESRTKARRQEQPAAHAAPSPQPAASPAAPVPAVADRAAGPVSGRTYTGSVTLPGGAKLELEGIVYSDTNATAVVNGRIVGEGAVIEGFTVSGIEETRVTFSGNGLTFFLVVR
jgi:hypothetical protein